MQQASFGYKKSEPVFHDVNIALSSGDIFSVLGSNGSGKSTLLNCMASMFRLQQGNILVNGRKIEEYSVEQLALEIAYIPQVQSTSLQYMIRDYVVMGLAPPYWAHAYSKQ